MIDKDNEDVLSIGKIVIYKNTFVFSNSIIQISNICSIWVADKSYDVKNAVPAWVKIIAGLGLAVGVYALSENDVDALKVAGGMIFVAVLGYFGHEHTSSIKNYALGIERSSGRVLLFTSPDKQFVKRVAQALIEVMSDTTKSDKIEMNFDNKTINIESAVGSNIIGGDVSDSLVESIDNDKNTCR